MNVGLSPCNVSFQARSYGEDFRTTLSRAYSWSQGSQREKPVGVFNELGDINCPRGWVIVSDRDLEVVKKECPSGLIIMQRFDAKA